MRVIFWAELFRPDIGGVEVLSLLFLQAMHGLSLDQTEYLGANRPRSMRFWAPGPTPFPTPTRYGTSAMR